MNGSSMRAPAGAGTLEASGQEGWAIRTAAPGRLARWIQAWRARDAARERGRLERELAALDAHVLRDLGLDAVAAGRIAWRRERAERDRHAWLHGGGAPGWPWET